MKKNLMLIHLESPNCLNYQMNSDLFPTLKEMENKCIVFDRYYSTATSTLMVISDLLYGGMEQYESCVSFAASPSKYCYNASLFDELKAEGYNTGIYTHFDAYDNECSKITHIAGFQNDLESISDYGEYTNKFALQASKQPFALMSCNYLSNMALNSCVDISRYGADIGYWEAGYRCMDSHCADLLAILNNNKLMENTVIVFYGDHGDDYWEHGMRGGLTHAILPYSQLIHTPLFIWDGNNRERAEHRQELIQTTDLKGIIEKLLKSEEHNIISERRYAISRNAYAAQPIREDSFNKGYSVTDGSYILMVTCRGLEMYDVRMDPSSQNNLLRFFTYQDGMLKNNEDNARIYKTHFASFWTSREQRILRQKFYELIKILKEETIALYKIGGRSEEDMEREMRFDLINNA